MESGVTTGWAVARGPEESARRRPRQRGPGGLARGRAARGARASGAPRMISRGSGQELHLPRQAGGARTGEVGAAVDGPGEGGRDAEDAREVRGRRRVVGHDGTCGRAGLVDGARGADGEGSRVALPALREVYSRRA